MKKLGLSGAILSPKIQDQDREKISAGNPADYACTTCLSYDRVKSFSFSWLLCRLSSIPFQRKYLALISHNTGHLFASSHRFLRHIDERNFIEKFFPRKYFSKFYSFNIDQYVSMIISQITPIFQKFFLSLAKLSKSYNSIFSIILKNPLG